MIQVQKKFGCVARKDGKQGHQMQLWMESTPQNGDSGRYTFVVRNVDLSSGGRRCELTRGTGAAYGETLAAGAASFRTQCGGDVAQVGLKSMIAAPFRWVLARLRGVLQGK